MDQDQPRSYQMVERACVWSVASVLDGHVNKRDPLNCK